MFTGYSEKTFDFMWGIRLNNNRDWFTAHKQDYMDHLYTPTLELGKDVYEKFMDKYPKLDLNLHVCRIYRDARRLHGQGPYKDHLWLTIRPENDIWSQQPVFWFEITPEEWSYGVGFWNAGAQTLAAMRRDMDQDPRRAESWSAGSARTAASPSRARTTPGKRANPLPCWRSGTTKRTCPWAGTARRTRRCSPPGWQTPWPTDTASWSPCTGISSPSARRGWRI